MVREEEETIDLLELFFMLLSRWKSILLAMLVGAVIFGAYRTFLVKPSYQANASIYITNTDSMITISDLQLSAALTEDYANIIKSRTVLKRVIEDLDLDLTYKELEQLVDVENPDSTHIVDVKVTCSDPELARDITNSLVNISVNQIYLIIGSSMPTVIDFSVAEAVDVLTPGLLKLVLMGALLGAVLICAIYVLQMLLDTTIKTEDDVEKYLHLPVLSGIPYHKDVNI
jgi:capsular polysaccharide biosynthesis protein